MTTCASKAEAPFLRQLYDAAVAAAHPRVCLPQYLPAMTPKGQLLVVGAGKAAAAMAVAAEQHYHAQGRIDRLSGLVTTRHGAALPTRHIEIIEAGHPVPDANSITGAEKALVLARSAGPDDLVVVLMSGGASALWLAPAAGITLEAKQALTKVLLRSGARISEMNTVRRHISRIKGGKLAAAAYPARVVTLAISDVPGDDPATIGSGPTVTDPSTLADARAVLDHFRIEPPEAIAAALRDPANETLKPGAPQLATSNYQLVATPVGSMQAAAQLARQAGYEVALLGDAIEGEAREVARDHAGQALRARAAGRKLAILSGGELTVTVTGAGRGGPNQEYALALAISLDGAAGISALAADTDGIDGGAGEASDPAGAMIFPDTLSRARAANRNAAAFLTNNDSTGFFAGIGDLVACGPTQTNVNDFRIILVDP